MQSENVIVIRLRFEVSLEIDPNDFQWRFQFVTVQTKWKKNVSIASDNFTHIEAMQIAANSAKNVLEAIVSLSSINVLWLFCCIDSAIYTQRNRALHSYVWLVGKIQRFQAQSYQRR